MNYNGIKKIGSVLLIVIGAVALTYEIYATNKNYYVQSAGLVMLMFGLFLVNSTIKPKAEFTQENNTEEEE